ncbi:MAG: alpha-L-fucosidase [Candidatus Brockarchaeota archaeon]|nr:alpha-L-fucosidase [Candidatus Brockarchaeota archaeon]
MQYEPTVESLRKHSVPDWFQDAKFGIIVHWGLYSVPGWAPLTGNPSEVISKEGWRGWFAKNPYSEWYFNSIRIKNSPSHQYHVDTYGENFSYDNFVSIFNEASRNWNPKDWADLFKKAGARYVIFVAKHHDGFLLWPSEHPNPKKEKYFAERDIIGELAEAVRANGLKMGLYYSGGLDWTFNNTVIQDLADLLSAIPQDREYAEYVDNHWHELIDRYKPSVVWGDIGYPVASNLLDLFSYYYNNVPDGVINDRFYQFNMNSRISRFLVRLMSNRIVSRLMSGRFSSLGGLHHDFRTLEYATFDKISKGKWECVQALGYSFGYNRNEGQEHILSLKRLVFLLVDVVSKNGNLLLGVGPMADGTIPEHQRRRLLELGQWLSVNGEAIYGTRPWVRAEGVTEDRIPVRFTQRASSLFTIILDKPKSDKITLKSLHAEKDTIAYLLSINEQLKWEQRGTDLTIVLPKDLPESPAYAIKITPKPKSI